MDKTEHEDLLERESEISGAKYVIALLALLALTALTFGLHYVTIGESGMVIALAIATTKVTIVALVFMELHSSMIATRMVALVSAGFLVLLCLGIFGDVGFR